MAYREIQYGDLVRIVGVDSILHGYNGIVIAKNDDNWYRVQSQSKGSTVCVWAHADSLLIRHDPRTFVIDGRIDEDARSEHERQLAIKEAERRLEALMNREVDSNIPCGVCKCCEAHYE